VLDDYTELDESHLIEESRRVRKTRTSMTLLATVNLTRTAPELKRLRVVRSRFLTVCVMTQYTCLT